MSALFQDLSYAARGLRLKPGFTLGVVITLALGIGANATMFGIVDRLLLRPPPYLASPDRVHRVWFLRTNPNTGLEFPSTNTSYKRYQDLRSMTTSFDVIAAYLDPSLAVGTGEDSREMHVLGVTPSYWRLFDMSPVIGRFFLEDENQPPQAMPVAVITWEYWHDQYGARRDILHQRIRIGHRDYDIIGVTPKGFMGTAMGHSVAVVPLIAAVTENAMRNNRWYDTYGWQWPEVFVRRKPGISVATATADLTAAFQRSYQQQRLDQARAAPIEKVKPHVVAAGVLRDSGPGRSDAAKVAVWLVGVAVIVLVIACANVGNLLLARAFGRRREIAVRLALGISRSRLLAQLLTESVLLALVGAAAGLAVAQWGGGILRATLLPDVDWSSTIADPRVVAFAAAIALAAGVLAGLAPAVHAGRSDVATALKAGVREGTFHRSRTRVALLVVQGALSVVLLVGAGLFVKSFHNVRGVHLGFDADRLLWVSPAMRGLEESDADSVALRERLVQRALRVPGVENSARALTVPFQFTWSLSVLVAGLDTAYISHLGQIELQAVSPGYFETMGTRILRGRALAEADRAGAEPVVVVSEPLAKALWRNQDAIGHCMRIGGDTMPCRTVVGIAEGIKTQDFKDSEDPGLDYYIPLAQWRPGFGGLYVRTRVDAANFVDPVRRALQHEMPGAAYVNVQPLSDIIAPQMRQWELGATMFSIFGVLALVVAAVGLYSVIAYGVAQRTHELGVRVALGAQASDVVRLVLGEGMRLATLAVAIGTIIAALAARWIAPLLFDTSPRDPAILAGVALLLLAISAAASFIPARRAASVDPNIALRAD